jgi:type IX secretion system PorP/SprF family membrane protein
MQKRFFFLIGILLLCLPSMVLAQGVTALPLTVFSPAQTGLYAGNYRLESGYFTQIQTQSLKGTQSVAVLLDAPLSIRGQKDWMGVGLNISHDVSGFAGLTTTQAGLNAAYHFGFDKTQRTVLSAGCQVNYIQRNIDVTSLVFQNDLLKTNPGLDLQRLNVRNHNYFDATVGLTMRLKPSTSNAYYIGTSIEHLLTPNEGFSVESLTKLARNYIVWASTETNVSQFLLLSSFIHLKKLPYTTEIAANITGGIRINTAKNIILRGGIGYQDVNRAQLIVGLTYDKVRLGLTYQTQGILSTTSNLPDFINLNISYIGTIYRYPNPKPIVLCPKY